jgi:hypothetical protein
MAEFEMGRVKAFAVVKQPTTITHTVHTRDVGGDGAV